MVESLLLVFVSWCLCVSAASVTGESDVIGSHEPVSVVVGGDVILPCHLEPPFDVHALTVEWTCNETNVHVYRLGKNHVNLQGENFKDRTSLFLEEMSRGNISLKLTNVSERDAGNYTCHVPKLHSQVRRGNVTLNVEPVDKGAGGNQTESQQDDQGGDSGGGEAPGIGIDVTAAIMIAIAIAIAIVVVIVIVEWMKRRRRRQRMEREGGQEPSPESIQLNAEQNTS